ncbi:calcium/sodium antiporter [Advenella sp. RU8]|uniref:calcium/sodium antiporter n=1 Tax=Advenella sp. RU8 TaxID=3399575 RepID=UPI003AAD3451
MELHPAVIFVAGLVIIILGAEMILRGAARIAIMLRVKPIIIGLTIVSIGTSTPELAVGITAGFNGEGEMAIGNIIGTNLVNILFILGLSAAIRALPIQSQNLKLDLPMIVFCSLVLLVFSLDGHLSRLDASILLLMALVYTFVLIRKSRQEPVAVQHEFAQEFGAEKTITTWAATTKTWNLILLCAGMALSILGADLLVDSAVTIAEHFGVSNAIIGLTIVAIGTSSPELVTTILSTIKNDRDVAIGNLIGSSIYNILFILGVTGFVVPNGLNIGSDLLWIDFPLMIAVSVLCIPIFKSQATVSRKEGAFFVFLYLAYMALLLSRI